MNILNGKCDLSPKFFFIILNLQHEPQSSTDYNIENEDSPAAVDKCIIMLHTTQNCQYVQKL